MFGNQNSFLVYGKVNVALEDLEPEIVCVNLRTGKAEGMGVINSPTYSYSIIVNLQAARKALSSECCLAKGDYCATSWFTILKGLDKENRVWSVITYHNL